MFFFFKVIKNYIYILSIQFILPVYIQIFFIILSQIDDCNISWRKNSLKLYSSKSIVIDKISYI